jgi:hypothetical protein
MIPIKNIAIAVVAILDNRFSSQTGHNVYSRLSATLVHSVSVNNIK